MIYIYPIRYVFALAVVFSAKRMCNIRYVVVAGRPFLVTRYAVTDADEKQCEHQGRMRTLSAVSEPPPFSQ